jgi:LPS sulfotransferase NodH
VTSSYLVCATPRSGSTLLCETLRKTGIAGNPLEFFEAVPETGVPRRPVDYLAGLEDPEALALVDHPPPHDPPPYSDVRACTRYTEHLDKVRREGTTPNGVFGAKIMWGHREDFLRLTRTLPEFAGLPERDLLVALFPNLKFVWVCRHDGPRQAVSLWKAIQTQSWRAGQEGRAREPVYDFEAIDHLRQMLDRNDGAWGHWFERNGVEPLEFRYRHIAADPAACVKRVIDHVGIDATDYPEPAAPMERQADDTSEDWVERYVSEREGTA